MGGLTTSVGGTGASTCIGAGARSVAISCRRLANSFSNWRTKAPPTAPRASARAFSALCAAVRANWITSRPLGSVVYAASARARNVLA
jgi:hypothetical protein